MRRVINMAHRGFTRDHPDNTLEAFRAALELGVDGVEFDVQETADGKFVIYHDDEIGGRPILENSLAELKRVRLREKYKIPALEDALLLLGRETIKMVEFKQVRSVERCLAILRKHCDISRLVVVSFNAALIAEVRQSAPDIMCAVIGGDDGAGVRQPVSGAPVMGIRCSDINEEVVARAHKAGRMVFIWDCRDEAGVRRVLQFEIDGIISDFPDIVKSFVN